MRPIAVDGVIVKDSQVLLILRNHEPFKGKWVLPGGFVKDDETVEEAVVREVREEVGVETTIDALIGVFSKPDRDPRHTVSIAFLLSINSGEPRPGEEADGVAWFDINNLPEMGFDHADIVLSAKRLLDIKQGQV